VQLAKMSTDKQGVRFRFGWQSALIEMEEETELFRPLNSLKKKNYTKTN
jgi:hypothetical protein